VNNPGVVLELRRYDWGGEVTALKAGDIDIAVVWRPNDLTGLRTLPLATEGRYIGLPTGHPLAARDHLELADIADIALGWTRDAPREWVDWWAVNPRPDGTRVRWGRENHNVEEMLEFAAAGEGACISPASMTTYYARPDLRWVPLLDVEPLLIDLAWQPDHQNATLNAFIAVARTEITPPER
jgi:DNA-binding transcriptional LysR family regulator